MFTGIRTILFRFYFISQKIICSFRFVASNVVINSFLKVNKVTKYPMLIFCIIFPNKKHAFVSI